LLLILSFLFPKNNIKKKPQVTLEPQQYLDAMIRSRGYSTIRYKALECGYYYRPSELQQASYDPYIIRVVKQNRGNELRQLLQGGMSPNPCNTYGESLLHTICRCGNAALLQIMLDAQSDIEVVDDYGRTPLHDACWSAKEDIFPVIELLLSGGVNPSNSRENPNSTNCVGRGPAMFYLADCRGSVPLQYVARDHWGEWIQWLEAHKDIYWPRRNRVTEGEVIPPPLTQLPPHSRAAYIPTNPLSPALAKMLVSGRMSPEEVEVLRYELQENEEDEDDSDDDDDNNDEDDDEDDDSDSDYDSDDDDDDSMESSVDDEDVMCSKEEEEEMANLIHYMKTRRGVNNIAVTSNDAPTQSVVESVRQGRLAI
jgi:Ankyrin repeats (3 copies)